MILVWSPVTATEEIPPFGIVLRQHLEKYRGSVKHSSCSAWMLLYKTLSENGLSVSSVGFTERGKPFFTDRTVFFSISHSGDLCAAAVADQAVGVDVERCRSAYDPRLIERSLTEDELRSFDGDFTRIWCRKEAVAKMTGEGMTGYPRDIDTTKYSFEERSVRYCDNEYRISATVYSP